MCPSCGNAPPARGHCQACEGAPSTTAGARSRAAKITRSLRLHQSAHLAESIWPASPRPSQLITLLDAPYAAGARPRALVLPWPSGVGLGKLFGPHPANDGHFLALSAGPAWRACVSVTPHSLRCSIISAKSSSNSASVASTLNPPLPPAIDPLTPAETKRCSVDPRCCPAPSPSFECGGDGHAHGLDCKGLEEEVFRY